MSLLEWLKIWSKILQFTPILQYRIPPPPPKMKIVRNLGTLTFQLQITPPPPPKMKIVRNLGTLTFHPPTPPPPPENENCQKSWHFDFSVADYPPPNENCQKSWHFDFSVAYYPPPPKIKI